MNAKRDSERLSQAIDRLLAGQAPAAMPAPDEAPEGQGLLQAAATVQRSAQDVEPRPEFRAAAKARFLTAFSQRARPAASPRWHWGLPPALRPAARLWLAAAASLVLVLGAGTGTVFAANSSLPQEPLYGVKRASERVQGLLALGSDAQVHHNLWLAERRLQDIVRSQASGREVPAALFSDLQQATDRTVDLMAEYPPREGLNLKQEALQKLAEVNASRQEALLAIMARAAPKVQASLGPALDDITLDRDRVAAALQTTLQAKESLQATPEGASTTSSGLITSYRTRTLVVGPVVVRFDDNTILEGKPAVGLVAEVAGIVQSDGSILARRVRIHAPSLGDRPGDLPTHKVVATVQAIGQDTWRADDRTIVVNSSTIILGAPSPGVQAELTVAVLPDGRILALRIAALPAAGADHP